MKHVIRYEQIEISSINSFLLIPVLFLYVELVQLNFYIKQIPYLKADLAFKFRFEKKHGTNEIKCFFWIAH